VHPHRIAHQRPKSSKNKDSTPSLSSQSDHNFNWGVVCTKMRSTHIRGNKYSQLVMGILVQVENTDKPFWKLNFHAAIRTL